MKSPASARTSRSSTTLILHGGALGDFVLTMHLVAGLRAADPKGRFEATARCSLLGWAVRHGAADAAHSYEMLNLKRLYSERIDLTDSAWSVWKRFDRVISFLGTTTDRFHTNMRRILDASPIVIDPVADDKQPRRHIVAQWEDRLTQAGVAIERGGVWSARLPNSTRAVARRRLIDQLCRFGSLPVDPSKCKIIIFHPGSGGRDKCAPIAVWEAAMRNLSGWSGEPAPDQTTIPTATSGEHWWRICVNQLSTHFDAAIRPVAPQPPQSLSYAEDTESRFANGNGWTNSATAVVWMIGPDEMEREDSAFMERLQRSGLVVYEESPADAADLVTGADLFVGHDAGMTHVAAACGVPTLALFGPTDPVCWRPLGAQVETLHFPGGFH